MIVLLHFFHLGYSPFILALLFLLYEFVGIFSNLTGGWLTSKFGIKRIILFGFSLQIIGILSLSFVDNSWNLFLSLIWIIVFQGICGIAKDLTKTASKSAIKVSSETDSKGNLFKLVSWFTGSKNSIKGIGFFLGGFLIQLMDFKLALWFLLLLLLLGFIIISFFIPKTFGIFKPSKRITELLSKSSPINFLSLSRVFMFGSRDIWFVVGLPVFLYSQNWSFWMVGSFLAIWTIGYGLIQGLTPLIINRSSDGISKEVMASKFWVFILTIISGILFVELFFNFLNIEKLILITAFLIIFGIVFAINSSLHSYLILAFSSSSKTTEDIGFYYAANAVGRFFGTLLSGLLYQFGSIELCLFGTFIFLVVCLSFTMYLPNKLYTHLQS
tara:strand:+ start:2782 stop:3936 length:1155 start_codon:yes stop_codon:yes gene_type:complete